MYESMPMPMAAPAPIDETRSPRSPEAIKHAAFNLSVNLLDRIATATEHEEIQSLAARFQVAQIAMSLPLASIGSCHCGYNLRYKGTTGGLLVCCTGDPEHCWSIG